MPARLRLGKRRHRAQITPAAVEIFRRAHRAPTSADRTALAAALDRSKFAANPLDSEPRSLVGCDNEPVEVVLEIRLELMKRAGKTLTRNVISGKSLPQTRS